MNLYWSIILFVSIILIIAGWLVFKQVDADYQKHGRLKIFSIVLEILLFFLHGAASYFYMDSFPENIPWNTPGPIVGVVFQVVGLMILTAALLQLGRNKTLGYDVSGLYESRTYRYSRNPQIISYGLVIIGYALLWPSWTGLLWIGIYAFIAHCMVQVEERHLKKVYGEIYQAYCARVPRYLGFPKQ